MPFGEAHNLHLSAAFGAEQPVHLVHLLDQDGLPSASFLGAGTDAGSGTRGIQRDVDGAAECRDQLARRTPAQAEPRWARARLSAT
jgi:hypothetical protein